MKWIKILICMSMFMVVSKQVVYADTLSEVLSLYGVTEDVISIDTFMRELEAAKESYYDLKDKYARDEFFRLTEKVASEMLYELPNVANSVETNEKYLISLVNVGADLELIFEAEAEYRAARKAYEERRWEREFSLEEFDLFGVTDEDVNAAVDMVNSVYQQISLVTYRPDIDRLEGLESPVRGAWKITSKYGYRPNPFTGKGQEFHNGLDLAGNAGMAVQSVFAGKVLFAGSKDDGLGNYVIVSHSNEFQTLYAHLSRIDVQVGDMVSQYQKIGEVGSTGRSTGPHLHLGVFLNGQKVDPLRLFGGRSE